MKLTIAAVALSAATLALGLTPPPQETKTICLGIYESADGVERADSCDRARNNATLGLPLLENGCAAKQISVTSVKYQGSKEFTIEIAPCLPPNVVQL